jgi:hypothetical protein
MRVINLSEGISSNTEMLGVCDCHVSMAIAIYDPKTNFALLCHVVDMYSCDGMDNIKNIWDNINWHLTDNNENTSHKYLIHIASENNALKQRFINELDQNKFDLIMNTADTSLSIDPLTGETGHDVSNPFSDFEQIIARDYSYDIWCHDATPIRFQDPFDES